MTYRYSNSTHTMVSDGDGMFFPARAGNRHFDALVAKGAEIAPYARFETVEAALTARLSELASRRWAAQTSMAYDGVQPVAYGADTAGNLLATMTALGAAAPGATAPWKLGRNEHRTWTLAQFQAFFQAGMIYIAACFTNEATLAALLVAAADTSIAAVEAVDLEQGWP